MGLLVDPYERVKVDFWIDFAYDSPRILNSLCGLTQGEHPCQSSCYQKCHGKWKFCDSREACKDEIGKLIERNKLPDSAQKFSMSLAKETYRHIVYAEKDSYEIDPESQQRYVNPRKYSATRFRLLLKEWDLDNIDHRFKIILTPEVGSRPEMLSDACFKILLSTKGLFLQRLMLMAFRALEHASAIGENPKKSESELLHS